MDIIEQVKAAYRVSVPIIAIETSDPAATIDRISDSINGDKPKLEWDIVSGLRGRNESGEEAAQVANNEGIDATRGNPVELFSRIIDLPKYSVVFVKQANRYFDSPAVTQAIWNLRDQFKRDGRMLILLGPQIKLPAELSGDVVSLDEPLPDSEQLETIIREQHDNAELTADDETVERAKEAVQGLPAFQTEQVVAMSLRPEGLDIDNLWERKRQMIEQTPGLKVYRGGERFSDVGGCDAIKHFLSRVLKGKSRPNAIVFIDEIEKMLAGVGGDMSGVSQDQLGSLLSHMEDNKAVGVIFVGPPGAAKSLVAKAAGNEAGVPTLQIDTGAVKGSLVGQSENQFRAVLKVANSVANGKELWIATCNKITNLPPELRRRFTLGTYFFDLPSQLEREKIWEIHEAKYGVSGPRPDDADWTGSEIKQACDIAWRLGCSLKESADYIVPVARSAADQIKTLCKEADGKFLSASRKGVYRSRTAGVNAKPKRRVSMKPSSN